MTNDEIFGNIVAAVGDYVTAKLSDSQHRIFTLEAELAAIKEQQKWRPVSEAHKDHGFCVFMDVDDKHYRMLAHLDHRELPALMTHFAKVPPLSPDVIEAIRKAEE